MSGRSPQQQSPWECTIDSKIPKTSLDSTEQCSLAPESGLSLSRTRSAIPTNVAGRRRRSFGSTPASRRNGTIDILGVESARSRRSSSVTATQRPTRPTTNESSPDSPGSPVIQELAYDTAQAAGDDSTLLGRWQCCECHRGHGVHRFEEGRHLISILSCLCPHRSCRNCTFQGKIRRFAPIYDVEGSALMPIVGNGGEGVYMGIVCRACGLSWQAQRIEAPKRHRSFRQRLSILPKKVNPMSTLRHARSMIHLGLPRDPQADDDRPGTSMSTSRSYLNLRSVSDTQAGAPQPEQQAQGVQVRFYGIECTCGNITDERDVCFVFHDLPKAISKSVERKQTECKATSPPMPPHLPELQAKGYGTPILHLKGGSHPNPLMSNPVSLNSLWQD